MPELYTADNPPGKKTEEKKTEPNKQPTEGSKLPPTGESARQVIDRVLGKVGEVRRSDLWGAYTVDPEKKFINEQKDEEVVLLLRAHPITNIKWMGITIVMLSLPQLLTLTGIFDNLGSYTIYLLVGKLAWYLMTLGYAFEKFLNWFYSVVIVTNERIVDIDYINLLTRVVNVATLNHIEEPAMIAGGFIRSLFNFGDVRVATAAKESNIEAMSVPFPEKVISLISELSEELEKRRERGE